MLTEKGDAVDHGMSAAPESTNGSTAPRECYAVLNSEYPAAYWQVALSSDIATGEVVPVHVLERDIVLWRDSAGRLHSGSAHCGHLGAHLGYGGEVVDDTLRCPFHGWRYDHLGKVVEIPGIQDRLKTRACLQVFRVTERFGAVFLWNGPSEPDQEFPDVFGELGIREDEVEAVNIRFKLWYAVRQLVENNPDAAHFAALHGLGEWGYTDTVDTTPIKFDVVARLRGRSALPGWAEIKRAYRRGELFGVAVNAITTGDIRTTFYGGMHIYHLEPSSDLEEAEKKLTRPLAKLTVRAIKSVVGRAGKSGYVLGHTPVDADSHILFSTLFLPRIKTPVLRAAVTAAFRAAMARIIYFAVWQDGLVMVHRDEPAKPAFHKSDRKLIEQRKFWDARVQIAAAAAGKGGGAARNRNAATTGSMEAGEVG